MKSKKKILLMCLLSFVSTLISYGNQHYRINANALGVDEPQQLQKAFQSPLWVDVFEPSHFKEDAIQRVLILSDVDGVIRESSLQKELSPDLHRSIRKLLDTDTVDIAFISGSPVSRNEQAPIWERDNVPLSDLFLSYFKKDISKGSVFVVGAHGGQYLNVDGSVRYDELDSQNAINTKVFLILKTFLQHAQEKGTAAQQLVAKNLENRLSTIALLDPDPPASIPLSVPEPYQPVVKKIHESIDNSFSLVNRGSEVEIMVSAESWDTGSLKQNLEVALDSYPHLSSTQVFSGFDIRNDNSNFYLKLSKLAKDIPTEKLIQEIQKRYPNDNVLTISLGDTSGDFAMHQISDVPFHFGVDEPIFASHANMVRGHSGQAGTHIEGTTRVLSQLQDSIGKPFKDFRYICLPNGEGSWSYYSLRQIEEKSGGRTLSQIAEEHQRLEQTFSSKNVEEVLHLTNN